MTMSMGPAAGSLEHDRTEHEDPELGNTLKPGRLELLDEDSTPRLEVPSAVNVLTQGATDTAILQQYGPSAGQDYFSSHPPSPPEPHLLQQQEAHIQSPTAPTPQSTTAGASEITAFGTILESAADRNATSAARMERPAPHTIESSMSVDSNDSTVTVTAIPHASRPDFPNQAYAALQDQQHRRYVPPLIRQRTQQHPVRINNWTNAIASSGRPVLVSRTADNSPAMTPAYGLFDINAAPRREQYRSPDTGTYSSPYLHFTQQQAPKETHVADVDVDPLTGNKLINHYEVVDEIGRGAHGKVKLGRDLEREDTYVAIKIVDRYSKRRKLGKLGAPEDKVKREVAILKKARHPNVVALLEVIDDPSRKKVYIVLEWVARGQIHWRSRAVCKEIAMVEARRYERERVAVNMEDEHTRAQEEAILVEAQKRLIRMKRQELRRWRQGLKNQPETPAFSHEEAGDFSGDDFSDDERSSRVSSVSATVTSRMFPNEGRLPSRPHTPVKKTIQMTPAEVRETHDAFLALTEEPRTSSPANAPRQVHCYTGLEGTMYGAYDPSSGEASARQSSEDLAVLAKEILDEDLNGELDYVPVMTLQQARVAFRDVLLGLQYLHYQGIVHRDIKPPNLLCTSDHRVKISDFGVSYLGKAVQEDEGENVTEHEVQELEEARELAKTVGTPAFFAPELCITDFLDTEPLPVTKAIDVWALGITLFCMIFARTPFVDNEFVVMRQIAEEEVYIPRKRLVPVVLKPASRLTSRSWGFNKNMPTGRREPYDLEYEGIDDDLYDLLKRLLTKDPRRRITLEEVRHHPWVVADLTDRLKWLEETDLGNWNEGKIEVSKEDVNAAVVPLQFLDRVRSTVNKIGEKLGLGSTHRSRAQSNAGSATGSPALSAHSSNTAISQEGSRKQSLRGDELIFAALHKSREGHEHRLAASASTSPENSFKANYFDDARSAAGSEPDDIALQLTQSRPGAPDRSRTVMSISTTASVRTIRQGDVHHTTTESAPPSPGLPNPPHALESPGGHGLGAILGSGPARRMLNSLRERSTGRGSAGLRTMSDRGSSDSLKAHSEASVAVSNTSASGQVTLPETLTEGVAIDHLTTDTERSLPPSSLPSSVEGKQSLDNDTVSRRSSGHSATSLSRWLPRSGSISRKSASRPSSRMTAPESSPEQWQRAEEEHNRRLIRERAESAALGPERLQYVDQACPPSSEDHRVARISRQPSSADISHGGSSHETSPMSHGTTPNPGLVSSSSEFGSAMSMSAYNPSIPSATSDFSSYDPEEKMPSPPVVQSPTDSSDGTVNETREYASEMHDDGYNPDNSAVDSDEAAYYDSSSDSDGGLVMTRRKSKVAPNLDELAPQKGRRDTDLSARSKRSSRSGSNNTVKKIQTRDSAEGRRARSPGIRED